MGEQASVRLSRRQAIGRIAGGGIGALAMLKSDLGYTRVEAQLGGVQPLPVPPDPQYPNPPTWEYELRELAPNVYGYTQAGGPGRNNGECRTPA